MKYIVTVVAFLLLGISAKAQTPQDEKLIKEAISNYVEAFYQADTSKAYASIAKDLAKRGYYTNNGVAKEAHMSFEQLVKLAQRWKTNQNITTARLAHFFLHPAPCAHPPLHCAWRSGPLRGS